MIRGFVCLVIVILVLAAARYFSRTKPASSDIADAIGNRVRDARESDRQFFARSKRDAAILKRSSKSDLPPGAIGESVKMPPRVVAAPRRRSRRRSRNAGQ